MMKLFKEMFAKGLRPPPEPKAFQPLNSWDLEYPLLKFSQNDVFSLRTAVMGVATYGGNGGGKSSGPGQALLKAFMAANYGGLVLTAKPDECELVKRYAAELGCLDRVVVFSPDEKWRFNFLAYEQRRKAAGAGLTANIVRLLTTIQDSFERGEDSGGKQERYWKNALTQLLSNAVDLALIAGETLSVSLLHQIITSAPITSEQAHSESFRKESLCCQLLMRAAHDDSLSKRQISDLDITCNYWITEFHQLSPDLRGSIISTFTTTADVFLRGMIGELFSTDLTIVPEITHHGKILVINLPVKTYGHVGLASQILWKYIWEESVERRDITKNPRPVFLWADEAHNFVNEHDVQFQTTARSSLCCTVFLSQTRSNYFWALGGEQKGKALTDSLMGVLQTKIFCANADPDTNQWAADVFAKSWQQRSQAGVSHNNNSGGGSNAGSNESLDYNVQPAEFLTLPKGGPANDYLVGAIISGGGKVFRATGQTYLKTMFRQR